MGESEQINSQEKSKKPNLPLKTIRRFIKEAGARRVSEEAAKFLANLAEDFVKQVAAEGLLFMEHAGRWTLLLRDLQLSQTEGVYGRLLASIRCRKCVLGQNYNAVSKTPLFSAQNNNFDKSIKEVIKNRRRE